MKQQVQNTKVSPAYCMLQVMFQQVSFESVFSAARVKGGPLFANDLKISLNTIHWTSYIREVFTKGHNFIETESIKGLEKQSHFQRILNVSKLQLLELIECCLFHGKPLPQFFRLFLDERFRCLACRFLTYFSTGKGQAFRRRLRRQLQLELVRQPIELFNVPSPQLFQLLIPPVDEFDQARLSKLILRAQNVSKSQRLSKFLLYTSGKSAHRIYQNSWMIHRMQMSILN